MNTTGAANATGTQRNGYDDWKQNTGIMGTNDYHGFISYRAQNTNPLNHRISMLQQEKTLGDDAICPPKPTNNCQQNQKSPCASVIESVSNKAQEIVNKLQTGEMDKASGCSYAAADAMAGASGPLITAKAEASASISHGCFTSMLNMVSSDVMNSMNKCTSQNVQACQQASNFVGSTMKATIQIGGSVKWSQIIINQNQVVVDIFHSTNNSQANLMDNMTNTVNNALTQSATNSRETNDSGSGGNSGIQPGDPGQDSFSINDLISSACTFVQQNTSANVFMTNMASNSVSANTNATITITGDVEFSKVVVDQKSFVGVTLSVSGGATSILSTSQTNDIVNTLTQAATNSSKDTRKDMMPSSGIMGIIIVVLVVVVLVVVLAAIAPTALKMFKGN